MYLDGEMFYQEFKDALHALGVDWAAKECVIVHLEKDYLTFTYGKRRVQIKLARE